MRRLFLELLKVTEKATTWHPTEREEKAIERGGGRKTRKKKKVRGTPRNNS